MKRRGERRGGGGGHSCRCIYQPSGTKNHQKLSANRSRWLNLDMRAVDTDSLRSIFTKRSGRGEVNIMNIYPCNPTTGLTKTPKVMCKLIYGQCWAVSNVVTEIWGQWKRHWNGFKCVALGPMTKAVTYSWILCKICLTSLTEAFQSPSLSTVLLRECDSLALYFTSTHSVFLYPNVQSHKHVHTHT